jgi:hypothetical protein
VWHGRRTFDYSCKSRDPDAPIARPSIVRLDSSTREVVGNVCEP